MVVFMKCTNCAFINELYGVEAKNSSPLQRMECSFCGLTVEMIQISFPEIIIYNCYDANLVDIFFAFEDIFKDMEDQVEFLKRMKSNLEWRD
jgi:hypothetical protein